MPEPEGSLTPTQFEILQLLWAAEAGLTVAEIWEAIRAERDVSRTTVLNLVDRLEKRGWLRRKKREGLYRYHAAVDRATTEGRVASQFVGEFFEGSPSSLLLSLLGSNRISQEEIDRLQQMLSDQPPQPSPRKRKGK